MKSLVLASAIALAAASTAGADANLIVNGNFDTDIVPWAPPPQNPDYFGEWDPTDSAGLQTSGSARVTSRQIDDNSANNGSGILECIQVMPGNYQVSAFYLIPTGQNHTALPDIAVAWFVDTSCQDIGSQPRQSLIPQGTSDTGAWFQLMGIVTAPSDAESANVILRPRKVEAQTGEQDPGVDVLFDAVFVPEPDATALGVTAAVAIAIRRRLLSCSTS